MNSETVKTIRISKWTPREEGLLPTRIVMWQREDDSPAVRHFGHDIFCTHAEIKQKNGDQYFYYGNYDMSQEAGNLDFERRCRQLGV